MHYRIEKARPLDEENMMRLAGFMVDLFHPVWRERSKNYRDKRLRESMSN